MFDVLAAEMWVTCLRTDINHCDDDTTALAEGCHSVLKSLLRAAGGEGLRVDSLIHFLLEKITEVYVYRDVRRHHSALLRQVSGSTVATHKRSLPSALHVADCLVGDVHAAVVRVRSACRRVNQQESNGPHCGDAAAREELRCRSF